MCHRGSRRTRDGTFTVTCGLEADWMVHVDSRAATRVRDHDQRHSASHPRDRRSRSRRIHAVSQNGAPNDHYSGAPESGISTIVAALTQEDESLSHTRAPALPSSSGKNLAAKAWYAPACLAATVSMSPIAAITSSAVASRGPGASASKSK